MTFSMYFAWGEETWTAIMELKHAQELESVDDDHRYCLPRDLRSLPSLAGSPRSTTTATTTATATTAAKITTPSSSFAAAAPLSSFLSIPGAGGTAAGGGVVPERPDGPGVLFCNDAAPPLPSRSRIPNRRLHGPSPDIYDRFPDGGRRIDGF